jgi:hypothetical protein
MIEDQRTIWEVPRDLIPARRYEATLIMKLLSFLCSGGSYLTVNWETSWYGGWKDHAVLDGGSGHSGLCKILYILLIKQISI